MNLLLLIFQGCLAVYLLSLLWCLWGLFRSAPGRSDEHPLVTVVGAGGGDPAASLHDEITKIEKRISEDNAGYRADKAMQSRYLELIGARDKHPASRYTQPGGQPERPRHPTLTAEYNAPPLGRYGPAKTRITRAAHPCGQPE